MVYFYTIYIRLTATNVLILLISSDRVNDWNIQAALHISDNLNLEYCTRLARPKQETPDRRWQKSACGQLIPQSTSWPDSGTLNL